MPRPGNKPDLDVEDAEKPKAGEGTKTAELVKAALSKALLARAAERAAGRSKALAGAMEDLGSRAIVPRADIRARAGHRIAELQRQADVFAGRGQLVAPRATALKRAREAEKSLGPRVSVADAEAAQMAGGYGDSVRAMNAKMDANLASRAAATRAGRGSSIATTPGIAPPPLPGTNVVTPSRAHVPQPSSAQAGQTFVGGVPQPSAVAEATRAHVPQPSSTQAGQTFVGGVPQPSAVAEGTRVPGPVAPPPMSPERVQALRAANPQTYGQAPAPRPMSLGRGALVLGSTTLAGAMMNRPAQQQQQAAY